MGIEFKGTLSKVVYSSETFKIYAILINDDFGNKINLNKYGNVTVKGDLPVLEKGVTYKFLGEEKHDKFGSYFDIIKMESSKPKTLDEMYLFLSSIINQREADNLFKEYPNIIEMVQNGEEPDLSRVKGVKEKKWKKIKDKINENFIFMDIISFFEGNLSMSVIKKLYEKYNSADKVKEYIRKDPYFCLCSLNRIGFKTADDIILGLDHNKPDMFSFRVISSKQRCKSAIDYILKEHENDGHTRAKLSDIIEDVNLLVPEAFSNFKIVIKEDNELKIKDPKRLFYVYTVEGTPYISRKNTYAKERYIAKKISESQSKTKIWDIDLSKYSSVLDFTPTDEQKEILKSVCNNAVTVLYANAGAGKTASTILLIKMLEGEHKKYCLLSPSGKASRVLSSYTMRFASTIHKKIIPIEEHEQMFNEDLVVIDEASMIDNDLLYRVLQLIDFDRTKLLLVGDDAQLPSVGCGNILHDFIHSDLVGKVHLTKIFRYKDGGLMKVATDARMSKKYLDKNNKDIVKFGNDYAFIPCEKEQLLSKSLNIYKNLLSKGINPNDIMFLTPYRKGNYGSVEINKYLQKLANRNARADSDIKLNYGSRTFYKNDIVIQVKNNYEARKCSVDLYKDLIDDGDFETYEFEKTFIANGETGIIKHISKRGHVIIDFGGEEVIYSKGEFIDVELGYALTYHKAQGDSSKYVIMLTSSVHTYMLNSNIIYVGLSRTKEKCFQVGDVPTVNRAIHIKENYNRDTNLIDWL